MLSFLDEAVSNYNGTSKFYVSNLGQLSSFSEHIDYIDKINVKVSRLDKVINEQGTVSDLIKIDAEGAEVECLEGLGVYINKVPELIVEISSHDNLNKILDILSFYSIERLSGREEQNYIFRLSKALLNKYKSI